jgi:hypothetical protein
MPADLATSSSKSRLSVLLEHFSAIDDPRDLRRIMHRLAEVLLLVVCGTIADCDDYDDIAVLGLSPPRFPLSPTAFYSGRAGRALAHDFDEPGQSGVVPGRVHPVGA